MKNWLAPSLIAAMLAVAWGALAQTAAPVQSATVNNIPVSGVAATAPNSGALAAGVGGTADLLGQFTGAKPAMPVLTAPTSPDPHNACGSSNC
jgi:hypothetical protein